MELEKYRETGAALNEMVEQAIVLCVNLDTDSESREVVREVNTAMVAIEKARTVLGDQMIAEHPDARRELVYGYDLQ